jgi:hypothetical protein
MTNEEQAEMNRLRVELHGTQQHVKELEAEKKALQANFLNEVLEPV